MLEIFVETKIESCRCDILISQATNLNLDEPNNAPYLVSKELPRCLQIRMEYEPMREKGDKVLLRPYLLDVTLTTDGPGSDYSTRRTPTEGPMCQWQWFASLPHDEWHWG
jgi:hypothetical protein